MYIRVEDLNAAEEGNITLAGVREHEENYPVKLGRSPSTGRLSVIATNEGGNGQT